MEKEGYVHRTGRTGRAGKEGKAITFSTPNEEKFIKAIERFIGFDLTPMVPPNPQEVSSGKAAFKEKISIRRVVKNNKTASSVISTFVKFICANMTLYLDGSRIIHRTTIEIIPEIENSFKLRIFNNS